KSLLNNLKLNNKFVLLYLPITLMLFWTLFPIYWIINTSFKNNGDILQKSQDYFPVNPTTANFVAAWDNVGFGVYFKNSTIVGVSTVLVVVGLSILAGYAISRYKFKGKALTLVLFLATQFIPRNMLIIPMFTLFKTMGLINSPLALVLTYSAVEIPFTAVLMSGFVSNVPKELEEAAEIDGCSKFQVMRYVMLPLLLPGISATAIFTFIYAWNEFLIALMLNTQQSRFTLPVGLNLLIGENTVNYGVIAAGGVIVLLPVILLFAYAHKNLISGMSGAVKG